MIFKRANLRKFAQYPLQLYFGRRCDAGRTKIAMETQDKAKRIRSAVARVRSYVDADRISEVRKVLADRGISGSTLRNYLNDPKKIESAYRWREFVEAVGRLPDLNLEKRNSAYEFTLAELGLTADSQSVLNQYRGDYRVLHEFSGIELNFLAVRTEMAPRVATFVMRYRNKNRSRGECDGLIVTRHGRMFFSGYSRTTIFQGTFKCVPFPDQDVILGHAFIEDMDSGKVYSSSVGLVRADAPEKDARRAMEYVKEGSTWVVSDE
jgi:hypothetical protein